MYPTSFFCLLHFLFFAIFVLTSPQKDEPSLYHIWTLVSRFAGVFCKSFLPPYYNWKVTSRLLGYFTKILQKNCREFFPTTAYKKEVRYNSNFLFYFHLVHYFNSLLLFPLSIILSTKFYHLFLPFFPLYTIVQTQGSSSHSSQTHS